MLDKLKRLIKRLLPASDDVMEQTVKSGVWVGVMNVTERGLELLLLVIVASLLSPRAVGLMGIALLTLSSLKKFSELGIKSALIQAEEDNVDDELNTAWTIETARGTVIAVILFLGAPFIASLFNEPAATDLFRVIALSPFIVGLRNPAVVYFQKSLDFHKEFVYRVSGAVAYFVVTVGVALYEPTVYALAIGYIAGDAARFLVSYLADGYRPWPSFDIDVAKKRYNFGKWVTANSILYFLYSRGDDAFVGWALMASALGFYQLAYRLSNAPATEITQTISSVTFSAYSKVQNDVEKLRSGYFQTLRMTTLASFPAAMGIAAVAPAFVEAFFTPEWQPMIPVMQLLAIYGLLRSMGATMGPVWKAVGRPDYIAKLSAVRVALIAIFIYPATMTYGIEGTAALITGIYIFPMMPIDTYLIARTVEASPIRVLKEVSYPLVASLGMAAAVTYVYQTVTLNAPVLEFILLVLVGIGVYVALALALMFSFNWEVKQNLESIFDALA
ncbi:lipopolysaccharide biosynthesis protein [Haloarcula sp. CBA1127]|uniref:lipopolysaccharide biosynthesis protein n=1 Tax=Haloarcula sp. CBA1127 TaxID=1765055 RepID=UPI00073EF515|nr:lipopolysaccharide biosynthesis protein [Haloarcula sp. CBA1127]